MIHIRVERNQEQQIERILVQGHAGYNVHGQDIVCAAVSSVTIGLVNAMEKMFHVQMHSGNDGDGKIDCILPKNLDLDRTEKIRLLMEALYTSLEDIANDFSDYVKIDLKMRKG